MTKHKIESLISLDINSNLKKNRVCQKLIRYEIENLEPY